MGGDWDIYSSVFIDTPSLKDIGSQDVFYMAFFEPGYMLLNSFLKTITENSQIIFIVSQLIVSTLLFKNVFFYSRYPLLSVFVYFGVLFLSLDLLFLRQAISVQLFFYGLRYIENSKFYKYFIVVTIAVLFHYSAIILYPLYFFIKKRYSNVFMIVVLAIGFILFTFQIDLISPFFSILPIPKVHEYMSHSEYGTSRTFGLMHVEIVVLMGLLLLSRKKMNMTYGVYSDIFINLFFIYAVIVLYTFPVVSFAGRVKFYFIISYVYIIPYLICSFNKISNRIVVYFILTCYLLLYQANIIFSEKGYIYTDYKNYLIEKI